MKYRNLGRTGVKVSPLCIGCMMFGNKTSPDESKQIIAQAFEAGINFFDTANVYGRGASGFFTEKYRDPKAIPADARLQPGTDRKQTDHLPSEPAYAVHRTFDALAKEHQATMSQIALAWNMAQPGVTSPIMGIRTAEQLTDNLGALAVELKAADLERIDAVAPPMHSIVPYGDEAAWGPHAHRI